MWISSCLTFEKSVYSSTSIPFSAGPQLMLLFIRLFYPPLCVPWLISFSANFITITQMILHTGVSKNAFQMRSFLTSKCAFLSVWRLVCLSDTVNPISSQAGCRWCNHMNLINDTKSYSRFLGCQQNNVCAFWFAREVWITLCLPGSSIAGVCLLKGPIDRPEAWAFPAERLLTALTVLWRAACQQLPLSIKQQLQVSTASGGEQGSSWRWGGTKVPKLALSNIFFTLLQHLSFECSQSGGMAGCQRWGLWQRNVGSSCKFETGSTFGQIHASAHLYCLPCDCHVK